MSDKWITIVPCYGRDYKSAKDVLKDWIDGKDFRVMDMSCPWDGAATSSRDHVPSSEYTHFKIRFKKLTNFTVIRRRINGEWTNTTK